MTTKKNENAAEQTNSEKKVKKVSARKTTTRKTTTTRRKPAKKAEEEPVAEAPAQTETPVVENPAVAETVEAPVEVAEEKVTKEEVAPEPKPEEETPEQKTKEDAPAPKAKDVQHAPKEIKPVPPLPQIRIESIVDLINAPHRQLILSDQQILQLTLAEAEQRFRFMEGVLAWILNYDVVITDTNIWIELLVGHTSNHSDPKVNARLLFERQLEFISKLTRFRGAKFLMMSETYEEIDRFATAQAPTNYKDADFTDETVCRNIAARLAKRLILSQQRENRLKIEGITSESHHASFADPAIIRRTVELFAQGKRVLLITNDASVGIRSIGMCDDLQRINNIDDDTWERVYTPLRPMVFTFDDLKLIDNYTRQYHYLQMAAGKQWMEDVPQTMEKHNVDPLMLWMDGFRMGDKYPESRVVEQQKKQQQNQNNQQKKQQPKPQQNQQKQETKPAQPKAEPKPVQPKPDPKPVQQKPDPKPVQQKQEPKPQEPVVEQMKEAPEVVAEPAESQDVAHQEQAPASAPKKRNYRRPQRGRKPKE